MCAFLIVLFLNCGVLQKLFSWPRTHRIVVGQIKVVISRWNFHRIDCVALCSLVGGGLAIVNTSYEMIPCEFGVWVLGWWLWPLWEASIRYYTLIVGNATWIKKILCFVMMTLHVILIGMSWYWKNGCCPLTDLKFDLRYIDLCWH